MPWTIVQPVPAEVWLLPEWTPISPWKWWVFARAVHQSMSYLWSKQFSYAQKDTDNLISELREELFGSAEACNAIPWSNFRNAVDHRDNYHALSWVLVGIYTFLNLIFIPFLRTRAMARRAEDTVHRLICIEDKNTAFGCIAPIASPMTLLVRHIADGANSEPVKLGRQRLQDVLWMSKNGLAVNVTNGVQTWDTAFAVQAIVLSGCAAKPEFRGMMNQALRFLDENQMDHSIGFTTSKAFNGPPTSQTSAEAGYRHPRKGAWGFSEKTQGYPVSDCTSEAFKAVLMLQSMFSISNTSSDSPVFQARLSEARIKHAVDIILTYQSSTGGCSCYEPRRGGEWLECLNPSQVFDKTLVAYDYPECTGSCLTALEAFRAQYPSYRASEIQSFIQKAGHYVNNTQREDGSWRGSWGICFTYASYFTLEALASQGQTYDNSDRVARACEFLVAKQNSDGGWRESYQSAVTGD